MSSSPLDIACHTALKDAQTRRVPAPSALLFLATGAGTLSASLRSGARLPLGRLRGVPDAWHDTMLHTGELGGSPVWLIEDAPGAPDQGSNRPFDEPPWVRAFPLWLAAQAGAAVCVHTSAGVALSATGPAEVGRVDVGSLALVTDHINLSGRSPLVGLGDSKLGPMFPDTSALHHVALRKHAATILAQLGVPFAETVAACTLGPTLETPAERAYWARTGAGVAVQNLADPLLACAHAGLAVLSVVAVTDRGEGVQDLRRIVAAVEKLAPALEDLLVRLGPELASAAAALTIEE
jgi:purine-nucleoside phosphorylase